MFYPLQKIYLENIIIVYLYSPKKKNLSVEAGSRELGELLYRGLYSYLKLAVVKYWEPDRLYHPIFLRQGSKYLQKSWLSGNETSGTWSLLKCVT